MSISCINKNSVEYQSLKDKADIPEFLLESICRGFQDRYGRFPYLDELPKSNSESFFRNLFKVRSNGGTKVSTILEKTGLEDIESANASINNEYRDLEVKIIPIDNEDAITEILHRPTDSNFNNLSEEDTILLNAPRDKDGNLLAPNGKKSNLTEKQYIQVRTKNFINWFGDWRTFDKNNPYSSKITVGEVEADYDSVDFNGPGAMFPILKNGKIIGTIAINGNYKGKNKYSTWGTEGYVSMSTVGDAVEIDEEQRGKGYGKAAYFEFAKAIAPTGKILKSAPDSSRTPASTRVWESLVRDGYAIRKDNGYEFINSSLTNASKVVDENGEPLVVYHGTAREFSVFNAEPARGSYFTSDKNYAKAIAEKQNYNRVIPVFLNIKNLKETAIPLVKGVEDELYWEDAFEGKEAPDGIKGNDLITGEIPVVPQGNEYIVFNPNQIKSATSNTGEFSTTNDDINDEPVSRLVLSNIIHKLATQYGIKFNVITSSELNSELWLGIIPDAQITNAFIYNGEIYINLDRYSVDSPLHEMFHLFIGSIRFSDPKLYSELVQSVEQFPNYELLVKAYPNRTRNDINEEIFVTEVSQYLLDLPSNLSNLPSNIGYELNYNIKRVLDTILMGLDSVKTIPENKLYNYSLSDIANLVNSTTMINLFHGTLDISNSEMHRKLNNTKSDLYKKGELIEQCE